MTTNGKGSMGEPSLGIQNKEGLNIRTNHQYYLDNNKYRREDTPVCMSLVHCTCATCGYEVTFPMSYRNVGFFLSLLRGTIGVCHPTGSGAFYAVGAGNTGLASRLTTNFIPAHIARVWINQARLLILLVVN